MPQREARRAEEGTEPRVVRYCVVPRALAPKVFDELQKWCAGDPTLRVVIEQRGRERRSAPRRVGNGPDLPPQEQRRIRNAEGRRVADRRATTVLIEPPAGLPRRAKKHAEHLTFVARLEHSDQRLQDIESSRLVVRFQSGDKDAMNELYLRYFSWVYAYARVALRDTHEAYDVTQDVFLRVFQALDRYEIRLDTPIRTWIVRIARNAIIDVTRARKRVLLEDPDDLRARSGDQAEPDAVRALEWLTDADLSIFIERLPAAQREVLVLRYMLGMKSDEIAAAINKSPKAVRQLHSRALARLEERLVAIGRKPARTRRVPMWVRMKPAPVMAARRFALAYERSSLRRGW